MKRRRQSTVPTLSLFPFLAVLLCTMGILVVFLYSSVRLAGEQAKLKRQVAAPPDHSAELQRLRAETTLDEIRVTSWIADRDRLGQLLQSARARQSELIRQIDEIRSEMATLAEELERHRQEKVVDNQGSLREMQQLQSQIDELERQIADRTEALDKSEPAAATIYSLVPYGGPGGTGRRPIYVECTADAVIFQPLGIHLTADDFLETGMAGNPLDAALAEIRDYWVRADVAGNAGRPYPLMIVRPDGAASYSAARRAMTSWTDEFGYELIAADLHLDTGEVDPELKVAVEKAIERSRTVMAEYHQQMEFRREAALRAQALERTSTVQGLRASRTGGGFVSSGGTGDNSLSQTNQNGIGTTSGGKNFGQNSRSGSFGGSNEVSTNTENSSSGSSSGNSSFKTNGGNASQAGRSSTGQANPVAGGVAANATGQQGTSAGAGARVDGEVSDNKGDQNPIESAKDGSNNTGNKNLGSCPCLADQRGEEWAIQRNPSQVTGYRRPILVWCEADSIRVDPGASVWLSFTPIPFNQSQTRTADQLVGDVNRVVQSWGTPPENGYWRPQLRIRVLPDGDGRAQEVRTLLDRSGIETAESR